MTVKELYDSIGGNYNTALQTMMSDAFIMRMLNKFVDNNSYNDTIISYEKKDFRGVFTASHSLKGVSGNLSLTPLYEKASAICEATRTLPEGESVNLDSEIQELKDCYELIANNIKALSN